MYKNIILQLALELVLTLLGSYVHVMIMIYVIYIMLWLYCIIIWLHKKLLMY